MVQRQKKPDHFGPLKSNDEGKKYGEILETIYISMKIGKTHRTHMYYKHCDILLDDSHFRFVVSTFNQDVMCPEWPCASLPYGGAM